MSDKNLMFIHREIKNNQSITALQWEKNENKLFYRIIQINRQMTMRNLSNFVVSLILTA